MILCQLFAAFHLKSAILCRDPQLANTFISDILLLSAFGYDAYGLDISSTALDLARNTIPTLKKESIYATRDPSIGSGVANFILGDFFKDDFKKEVVMKDGEKWDGKFDLLYDYTVSLLWHIQYHSTKHGFDMNQNVDSLTKVRLCSSPFNASRLVSPLHSTSRS